MSRKEEMGLEVDIAVCFFNFSCFVCFSGVMVKLKF